MTSKHPRWLLIGLVASLVACSAPSSEQGGEPLQLGAPEGSDGDHVVVGFYADDQCAAGTEAYTITFDISQSCFGWSREAGARGTVANSATNFQCYQDRLCYSQHTDTLICEGNARQNKQARIDQCIKEPMGDVWSKLISGTESCAPAPAGFECP